MRRIDGVCQSGGRINENGNLINEDGLMQFTVNNNEKEINFTIVMDGATGLGKNNQIVPGYTSAEWYVQFMLENFRKSFEISPTENIQKIVEESIERVINKINQFEEETGIKLAEYEMPSSSLAIQRDDGKKIELFLLGDTETIIEYRNGKIETINNPNQKALKNNDEQVINRMYELSIEKAYDVLDAMKEPEIINMLRINREKKNRECEGVYWTLGTTKGITEHGTYIKIPRSEVTAIFLATDGFNREEIEKDEVQILKLINDIGLSETLKLIRESENNDLRCNKYPRFKAHDDATAVYEKFDV